MARRRDPCRDALEYTVEPHISGHQVTMLDSFIPMQIWETVVPEDEKDFPTQGKDKVWEMIILQYVRGIGWHRLRAKVKEASDLNTSETSLSQSSSEHEYIVHINC